MKYIFASIAVLLFFLSAHSIYLNQNTKEEGFSAKMNAVHHLESIKDEKSDPLFWMP